MHELVHYWFLPAENYFYIYQDRIEQPINREWQANEGAAQALMPMGLFVRKYHQYGGNVGALADLFNVGTTAVQYRVQNLRWEIRHSKYAQNEYNGYNSFSEFFVSGL
jgi:Zn-dependent peptidase ImmA (M78 family)